MSDEEISGEKGSRERSPSFPFIPLKTAIERLTAFEDYFKRHPSPADKAGLAWGMKGYGSQTQQMLAALKSFGLVEYQGTGPKRSVSVSEEGRTYLRAQQDSIKKAIIKRAALKPKLIEKYWSLWGADRPPDAVCLDELVLKGAFPQNAAETFLRVYDSTIDYAGLSESDKINNEEVENPLEIKQNEVAIGDLVQWVSQGSEQFQEAKRVRALSDDKKWAFVDGSETGIPMEQIELVKKGSPTPPPFVFGAPPVLAIPKSMREAKFALKEGDVIVAFPSDLSSDSVEDLEAYFDIFIKKAKRDAVASKASSND
ncbi:MAG: hypothetical protein JO126_03690 [Alphaproteobacteria bacterium]|nr:hypothetical protein [Alphaproteobacteria bacterium]